MNFFGNILSNRWGLVRKKGYFSSFEDFFMLEGDNMEFVFKDHYKTLGAKKDTNYITLKECYNSLLKKYKLKNDFETTEKVKELTDAYMVLTDPIKKALYDIEYDIDKNKIKENSTNLKKRIRHIINKAYIILKNRNTFLNDAMNGRLNSYEFIKERSVFINKYWKYMEEYDKLLKDAKEENLDYEVELMLKVKDYLAEKVSKLPIDLDDTKNYDRKVNYKIMFDHNIFLLKEKTKTFIESINNFLIRCYKHKISEEMYEKEKLYYLRRYDEINNELTNSISLTDEDQTLIDLKNELNFNIKKVSDKFNTTTYNGFKEYKKLKINKSIKKYDKKEKLIKKIITILKKIPNNDRHDMVYNKLMELINKTKTDIKKQTEASYPFIKEEDMTDLVKELKK